MNRSLDEEQIRHTIMTYVNGVINFDFNQGESAWHPDGVKISSDNGDDGLILKTILDTRPDIQAEDIERIKSSISQKGWIESVDYSGIAAAVRLEWISSRQNVEQRFTDFILLLKIHDEWKIVAKVSYQRL